MIDIMQGGEAFFFPGGHTGVLLVHGFTGTPFEMRWLGEELAERGFTVLGIRLFGHATRQEDLIHARWQDWAANLEDGYHLLKQSCETLFVGGLSLGGALSLHSAVELPWNGVFSMSAPYVSPDRRLSSLRPLLPLVSRFWHFSGKSDDKDWADPALAEDHLEYPSHPVRSGVELDLLLGQMRGNLSRLEIPLLIIHSKSDQVVPWQHAEQILSHAASGDKRMVLLEKSGHGITRDVEREQVLKEITNLITHCSNGEPS